MGRPRKQQLLDPEQSQGINSTQYEHRPMEFSQDEQEAIRKIDGYLLQFGDTFPYLQRTGTNVGVSYYNWFNSLKKNPPVDIIGRPIGDIQITDILLLATRRTPVEKEDRFFGSRTQMGPHEGQALPLFKMVNGQKQIDDGWMSVEVHFKSPVDAGRKIVFKWDNDVTDLKQLKGKGQKLPGDDEIENVVEPEVSSESPVETVPSETDEEKSGI